MSVVTLEDKTNALLKRREMICVFRGQAGRLGRSDAVKLLSEELKLGKKFVVPIMLKCETGKADLRGTFYVYDDEDLAKKHLPKYILKRLSKKKGGEEEKKEEKKEAKVETKEEKKEGEQEAKEKVEKAEVKEKEVKEKADAKEEKKTKEKTEAKATKKKVEEAKE